MMSALIPPAAATEALALLAIIADPAAATTKLNQLLAENRAAKARIDEANELTRQLEDARASWGKEREQALAEVDTKMAEADRRLAAIEARETAWARKEQALADGERRLAELDLQVASRQQMLDGINGTLAALREKL
jgi:chromosome segregation ATPase